MKIRALIQLIVLDIAEQRFVDGGAIITINWLMCAS
jgi:hypothetical protein